jgi:hypothetical protein
LLTNFCGISRPMSTSMYRRLRSRVSGPPYNAIATNVTHQAIFIVAEREANKRQDSSR